MQAVSFFSPAQISGYVALVFGVAAFLQKRDQRLKALNAAESVAYVAHFLLLGNLPASGSALVATFRNLTSLKFRSSWLIAVFMTLTIAVGVAFTKNTTGWFPVVASSLATVAIFRLNGIAMRMTLLVCTILWLANNILSGSIGGTVLEAIIAVANTTTIWRLVAEHVRTPHEGHMGTPPPQALPVRT